MQTNVASTTSTVMQPLKVAQAEPVDSADLILTAQISVTFSEICLVICLEAAEEAVVPVRDL